MRRVSRSATADEVIIPGLRLQARRNTRSWERVPTESFVGPTQVLDLERSGLEVVTFGDVDNSPFRGPRGLRVLLHPKERGRVPNIVEATGRPLGRGPTGYSTSAIRTFYVGNGHFVKGSFPAPENEPDFSRKELTVEQAALAVARSEVLAGHPNVMAEPAAIHVPALRVTAIDRRARFRLDGTLRAGDLLDPWHVFASEQFRDSRAGDAIYSRFGGFEQWVKKEVLPRMIELVARSFFGDFWHFELHAQNLELLVDAQGHVMGLFIKDLSDARFDPAAQLAATGATFDWETLERLRGPGTGKGHIASTIPESGAGGADEDEPDGIRDYYQTYFNQLRVRLGGDDELCRMIVGAVMEEGVRRLEALGFNRDTVTESRDFPEIESVFGEAWKQGAPSGGNYREFFALEDLRNLLIKAQLTQRFDEDPAAEDAFSQAVLYVSTIRAPSQRPGSVFGWVGSVPARVARDPEGRVTDFVIGFGPPVPRA